MIYIGTFGLEDPLRENIDQNVDLIKYGQIIEATDDRSNYQSKVQVRMISGDHIDTCKQTALLAGIITDEEMRQEDVVITGEEFR